MMHKKFHHIGGVPYAALPLASGIALLYQKPMIMIRKADHQIAKAEPIEGIFKKGDKVILVEDVVASGASIEQTIDILTAAGLTVVETVVLLDRQQGARKRLAVKGIKLTTLCTLSQALSILHQQGHLDRAAIAAIDDFIQEHQF